MRAVLIVLLLANAMMVALLVTPMTPSGVEPERLARQVNADRISVIDPAVAAVQATHDGLAAHRAEQQKLAEQLGHPPAVPLPTAATPAPATAAPVPDTHGAAAASSLATAVCVELGDFSAQAAESFEPQLSRLSMTGIPQRRIVQPPPAYLVFVPPQPTEAAATRRLAGLRAQGFTDSAVIRDESPRRWGVSAGLFSKEELAIAQLDKLHKAGVADARMGEYPLNSTRYAYRLPGVTETGATRLAAVASNYAGVTMRSCGKQ